MHGITDDHRVDPIALVVEGISFECSFLYIFYIRFLVLRVFGAILGQYLPGGEGGFPKTLLSVSVYAGYVRKRAERGEKRGGAEGRRKRKGKGKEYSVHYLVPMSSASPACLPRCSPRLRPYTYT